MPIYGRKRTGSSFRYKHGDQQQVLLTHFAELVRDNIPEWLRKIIRSFGPSEASYAGEIQAELEGAARPTGRLAAACATTSAGSVGRSTNGIDR